MGGHLETRLGTFTVKLKYKLDLNVIVTEKQKPHVLNYRSNLIKLKGLMKIGSNLFLLNPFSSLCPD